MADGFQIDIDGDLAARLKARADEAGLSPADLARELLEQRLLADAYEWEEEIDPDPAIDERIAEETLRKGDGVPLEEALSGFRSELKRALAKRA
jgi:hypothetical protein